MILANRAAIGLLAAAILLDTTADADEPIGSLELVEKVSRSSLGSVTSVEVSKDGRHLYAAAWNSSSVNAFTRDKQTGKLTHLQEYVDEEYLDGAVALRLSPGNRYAVVTSFRSGTVSLFERQENGELNLKDVAVNGENDVTGIDFAIDTTFSPDGKFVYVANGRGLEGITTFAINDGKLEFLDQNSGIDGCLDNTRGLLVHPDKKSLFAASCSSGSVVIFDRDLETGIPELRQIVEDDDDFVLGLEGVMALAISPDGKFVYTNSGRFSGDSSVGVFEYSSSTGRLEVIQELSGDDGTLANYVGGNEIVCSADGRNIYAIATRSSSIACLSRDVATGQLEFMSTVDDKDGTISGAAGICMSPDDRFVYVAAENTETISVFQRAGVESDSDKTGNTNTAADVTKDAESEDTDTKNE